MLLIDKEGVVYEWILCLKDYDYRNSSLSPGKGDLKMPSWQMQYVYGLFAWWFPLYLQEHFFLFYETLIVVSHFNVAAEVAERFKPWIILKTIFPVRT